MKVGDEIAQPKRSALADGGGLGGLIVREGERGQILVLLREVRRRAYRLEQQRAHLEQPFLHLDDIGVVPDIAGGRTEVDDGLGLGTALAVGQHMRHDIVPDLPLAGGGEFVVDVVDMRPELLDLLLGNVDAELPLRLRERHPQPAPCGELEVRGEDMLHPLAGVAFGKGGDISVHLPPPKQKVLISFSAAER